MMEGLGNPESSGILQAIVCESSTTPFPVSPHSFSSQLQLNPPQEFLLRRNFRTEVFSLPFLISRKNSAVLWADQQHSESHILVRSQAQFESCPGICSSFLNPELVPDVRAGSEILGNQALLNISNLQNMMEKSNLCWELLKAAMPNAGGNQPCIKHLQDAPRFSTSVVELYKPTENCILSPQPVRGDVDLPGVSFVWLPPQGFSPSGWLLDALRSRMGIPMPSHQRVPVLPDNPAGQDSVEPNKTVKIPPPKTWSDSKEPPFLILLLLPAKEHLPDCFNLQDPSYFNPIEKDWCFGVVLGYIKIHISSNKCFPFIQPSLFSMEPNFQAVSSTFQEYEAPFSSCANTVMPPIIYV